MIVLPAYMIIHIPQEDDQRIKWFPNFHVGFPSIMSGWMTYVPGTMVPVTVMDTAQLNQIECISTVSPGAAGGDKEDADCVAPGAAGVTGEDAACLAPGAVGDNTDVCATPLSATAGVTGEDAACLASGAVGDNTDVCATPLSATAGVTGEAAACLAPGAIGDNTDVAGMMADGAVGMAVSVSLRETYHLPQGLVVSVGDDDAVQR